MARKMTMGRRKIEMKLIPSKDARQVTFSKRRVGLFKKASELCTLTGCEIAMVVFSPGGKAFSFGHPCVGPIVQRFLYQSPMPAAADPNRRGSIASTLNQQYNELCKQLEAEKQHGKELEESGMKCPKPYWFNAPIGELNSDQLVESKKRMGELRDKVAQRVDELSVVGSAPTFATGNFVGAIDLNVPAVPDEI
ncbi:MADS-box transcription factor family protein [Actinidia rufa]|uniref:MADS-box transcription factor family protein n=1 Tax=Actinidia rufa TaxID=165716 RepID=A0A7J0H6Y3_9ERIC|nr:MADS-box transcription factor family protein [Actinidia rufa]